MAKVNVLPLTVGHREVLLIRAIVINACARLPLPAPARRFPPPWMVEDIGASFVGIAVDMRRPR